MNPKLGSCYYPEHWSEDQWQKDAEDMIASGLTWVRIGEFAWSRLEPEEGDYNFEWLDRAISILGSAGLNVVMSTPTATPPRWVVDKWPDMLIVDVEGRTRRSGRRGPEPNVPRHPSSTRRRPRSPAGSAFGSSPHTQLWLGL